MENQHFDTVIIGSGIGGLATAKFLDKVFGEKVLILEQHFKLGGLTHTFKRRGFEWDVGVHYVGEMQKGGFTRKVMDFLTDNKLKWNELADPFESFEFKNFKVGQPWGRENWQNKLIQLFQDEEKVIRKYFKDLQKVRIWFALRCTRKVLPKPISLLFYPILKLLKDPSKITLNEYFDEIKPSPKLKALLCAQCGNYGLPPNQVSWLGHALVVCHYLNGAFYPKGGAGKICSTMLEDSNIVARTNCEVTEIILSMNKKISMLKYYDSNKKEYVEVKCKKVVSSVGVKNTFINLLKNKDSGPYKEFLNLSPSFGITSLYIGMKSDFSNFDFRGENHWIFDCIDFDDLYRMQNSEPFERVYGAYITFPSLKDKGQDKKNTMEVMINLNYKFFEKWEGTHWKNRGQDYSDFKDLISNKIIDLLEKYYPSISDYIEYSELATPLSTEYFVKSYKGGAYGIPFDVNRYKLKFTGPRTPYKGLFLSGADVFCHGFVGAMYAGLCAATSTKSFIGVVKIFKAILNSDNTIERYNEF